MHQHFFKNVKEAYQYLYYVKKNIFLQEGLSEDKSSRKANIYAVKNSWKFFNK